MSFVCFFNVLSVTHWDNCVLQCNKKRKKKRIKIYKHPKTCLPYRQYCINLICLKQLKLLFVQCKRMRITCLWKLSLKSILFSLAFTDIFAFIRVTTWPLVGCRSADLILWDNAGHEGEITYYYYTRWINVYFILVDFLHCVNML